MLPIPPDVTPEEIEELQEIDCEIFAEMLGRSATANWRAAQTPLVCRRQYRQMKSTVTR